MSSVVFGQADLFKNIRTIWFSRFKTQSHSVAGMKYMLVGFAYVSSDMQKSILKSPCSTLLTPLCNKTPVNPFYICQLSVSDAA